jgi:glucan phosphoethanolaminetransferase (alkaline phosphatase superfamily)
MSLAAATKRLLVGEHSRALLALAAPTLLFLVTDLAVRGPTLGGYAPQGTLIYMSSWLVSAAFWVWPSWVLCRILVAPKGGRRSLEIALVLAAWIVPFTTFCFAGQFLYYRVFHSYVGRDTVRLGIALRGTVGDWFDSWGGTRIFAGMLAIGCALTMAIFLIAKRVAPRVTRNVPILPIVTFLGAGVCFWTDNVDSRFLQAALPDTCFVHGVVHALRVTLTGKGDIHQGMSIRTPAPLPPLRSSRAVRPNVLVILTESVRADALCSEPPSQCRARFLDDVAPDRIALGRLTTQTPNTFSSFLILTTGLAPNVDFRDAHTAPVLWEIARAVGYRTAYVSSQNPKYEDFGAFTERAGIDVRETAIELGGLKQEQLGAPDERATERMLAFLRDSPEARPYFAVLHLSNTHAPYRTDPELLPFQPESVDPVGDAEAFHNHYRNSVLLEERVIAAFLREVRALPSWDTTALILLSDHGEQFREHGGLYHNHSLYDQELRVPGFLVAGGHALAEGELEALSTHSGERTFSQDVNATLVDLLGVSEGRTTLPLANLVGGESLLARGRKGSAPVRLLATSTSVWEPDDAWFGAMDGGRVLMGTHSGTWRCFDLARDPDEERDLGEAGCPSLVRAAKQAWP